MPTGPRKQHIRYAAHLLGHTDLTHPAIAGRLYDLSPHDTDYTTLFQAINYAEDNIIRGDETIESIGTSERPPPTQTTDRSSDTDDESTPPDDEDINEVSIEEESGQTSWSG